MTGIAYCNPFVPPEWIAAHGLQPGWMDVSFGGSRSLAHAGRALCPYAGAVVDEVLAGLRASAMVLTTTCDQMRHVAAVLQNRGDVPVFLMNVPATWQAQAARQLYQDELERLGRFLVRMGGRPPTGKELTRTLLTYDDARRVLHAARARLSAAEFATAVAAVRGARGLEGGGIRLPGEAGDRASRTTPDSSPPPGVPLALLGGPLLDKDRVMFDLVERAGGRVVLDATEGGERTLPARLDPERVCLDPLGELTRAYFDEIPAAFRRPNDRLYQWLGEQLARRQVRGVLLHRYVWCDLWHAELARLKEWSSVPVLEIDECDDDAALGRTVSRIEAFLEMLT